ncbi:MAG: hypothetical protein L6Q92_05655 [Phycisphaerae bacterium]|nr:hypothetical protein [Phycisphaerae bacterium]
MNSRYRALVVCASAIVGLLTRAALAPAGSLTPPLGPIGPTMKTLVEVEPRTPVQSLPGSASAVHVISAPGSYYLTADVLGQPGKHAIDVTAVNGVTIDLRGFALRAVVGSLDGINAAGDLAVRNGSAIGWSNGVNVCNNALLENLRFSGCAVGATVCRGQVIDCVAQQNQIGFAGFGVLFQRCTATSNASAGFSAANGSAVIDCVASSNGRGIAASGGSQIERCAVFASSTIGIELADFCRVAGNNVDSNGTIGIFAYGEGNTIDGNMLSRNPVGIRVTYIGNFVVRNRVRNATTGYDIAAGNDYAQIIGAPGANFVVTNAWANFGDLATPTCTDGIQNGGETDVDCGGGNCPPCQNGQMCATASDCVSGVCMGGVCQPSGFCQSAGDCPPKPNATATCVASACQYACLAGFGDCDNNMMLNGCEASVLSDNNHCGACNNVCPQNLPNATTQCGNGNCNLVCNAGYADCNATFGDGCEVNTQSDVDHCSACNVACPNRPNATRTCVNGVCGYVCNAGYNDCNGNPNDGCEVFGSCIPNP